MDKAFQSGFASALMEIVFAKVTDVVILELKKILYADKSLIKLESTAKKGHNLFNCEKIFHLIDTSQPDLLSKLEELARVCYDVEDIIDDIALDIANHNLDSSSMPVLGTIWRSPKNLSKPHSIKKLQEKLDFILADVHDIFKNSSQFEPRTSLCFGDQKLSTFFVGREVEIEDIVQKLISNDDEFNGVSILGMDGLGKTELALAILEDRRISERFYINKLVHVLDGSFDFRKAIDLLDGQFTKNGFIKEKIQNVLIIIDNLLDISLDDWDKLWIHIKSIIINTNIKILITTLNLEVSKTTGTFPYYLKPLSDKNCKTLIVNKALSHNQNLSEVYLSNYADILAKKCEGLPIVARILGVVLARCSMDKRAIMLKEDVWNLPEFKKEILPILRSSYLNMHPQLKQCVAYFSLFSDGYHFNIHKLVHLWAGEGFLHQHQGTLTFNEIGNYYFSCLRGRSIIQHCNDANNDEEKMYELHKFTQRFSQLAASKMFVRFEIGMKSSSLYRKYARHLSFLCDNMEHNTWVELEKMKRLRTILALHCRRIGQVPDNLFKALTRLRVLALNETDIIKLPDSICGLNFLRYLDISRTRLGILPRKISKLSLLNHFHLQDTQELFNLPFDFCKLTNLVSLDWKMSDIRRFGLPSHIGKLSNLQTLPLFTVKDEEGYRIEELKNMDDLQGSLCITNLEKVMNKTEAGEAMLHKKLFLKRIDLQWISSSNDAVCKEVLECLKPHCYLKELNIINYGGDMFPEWIFHPSQMFEKIHLERCLKCNVLPAFGGLQNLETLFIEHFSELQLIDHEFCGPPSPSGVGRFPKLESLYFKNLPQLCEWKGLEANDFPRLRILKVEDCSQITSLPSLENLTSLVELQIESCPTMRSLPELPASVESIKIRNSDLLKERCVRGGEAWQKIDCVTKVEIDNIEIQTSGTSTHRLAPPDQHQNTSIMYRGYRVVKNISGELLDRLVLRN
ncbi:unnamed protein product [Amaranthus hypochondriacus]